MVELRPFFPQPRRTDVPNNNALCELLDEDHMSFLIALQQLHRMNEEKAALSGYMLHEITPRARRTHMFPFGAMSVITKLIQLKFVESKLDTGKNTPSFVLTQAGLNFQTRKKEVLPA